MIACILEILPRFPRDVFTCLKPKEPKGLCKNKRCSEEEGVPQVLLCAECTPWAACKGWALFSILMCRKTEHGQDQPKPADARKFFEKYLGKLNTSIADTSISFAVNFNYQVYSICEKPSRPSTSTPTFDSELGVDIDMSAVTVSPEILEHSFYLMH